jgi:hypothetical protein
MGGMILSYTMSKTVLQELGRCGEDCMTVSADNGVDLAWLEGALAYAFAQRRPELWAYLEAVIDEVLFEMELEARL